MIKTALNGYISSAINIASLSKQNTHSNTVEPSGVQALKNPNPLKDVEALVVLGVVVLV